MQINFKKIIRTNLLTILTITGVIFGIVIGLILRSASNNPYTPREVTYVNFIGDLFLRMLKSLILPLIISSLIAAIGSLDLGLSGKIGGRAVAYYIITTVIAVILGIILVTTIRPGASNNNDPNNNDNIQVRNITTADTLLDLVRNMFPPNVIQACTQQYQTILKPPTIYTDDLSKWIVTGQFTDGMNILGLVVVSVVVGIAISSAKQQAASILKLVQEISQIMMNITSWVIWLSPIGVLFLICSKILELDDLGELTGKLGLYFVTVAGGILFHGFIILPIIYFLFTRKNPYKFIANMSQAMATAFGTASSSATLPVTINCLENKNQIDARVSRFVLPIGATINMDGTALYEAVAAIFISQVRDIDLSFGQIVAICITATAASIGAAGIPQAGLVTIVMVLDTVGLPAEDVSLIIAVDWLLDRVRTMVNVLGDAIGAGIVAHLSRKELDTNFTDNQDENNIDSLTNGKSRRSSLNLIVQSNNTIVEEHRM